MLALHAISAAMALDSHPTLPTMWTAIVKEDEVGIVTEAYKMVDKPTPDNPSAKWTNYTDGSCQRLIWVGNNYDEARYLFKCDAIDCCYEEQSGNHVEYQVTPRGWRYLPSIPSRADHSVASATHATRLLANVANPVRTDPKRPPGSNRARDRVGQGDDRGLQWRHGRGRRVDVEVCDRDLLRVHDRRHRG